MAYHLELVGDGLLWAVAFVDAIFDMEKIINESNSREEAAIAYETQQTATEKFWAKMRQRIPEIRNEERLALAMEMNKESNKLVGMKIEVGGRVGDLSPLMCAPSLNKHDMTLAVKDFSLPAGATGDYNGLLITNKNRYGAVYDHILKSKGDGLQRSNSPCDCPGCKMIRSRKK